MRACVCDRLLRKRRPRSPPEADPPPRWRFPGHKGREPLPARPSHSALYNRAEVPGKKEPLRLWRIGETRGTITTLLRLRTGKLAQLLQEVPAAPQRVSMTYGTGGAKRQRVIEAAVHAGIRGPVYGLRLVEIGRAPEADAIVSRGNTDERITLPGMPRLLGGTRWLNAGVEGFTGRPRPRVRMGVVLVARILDTLQHEVSAATLFKLDEGRAAVGLR